MLKTVRRMASFQNMPLKALIWFVWGFGGVSAIGVVAFLDGNSTLALYVSTVGVGLFLIGLIFTLLVLKEIRRRVWNLEHMDRILSGEDLPSD